MKRELHKRIITMAVLLAIIVTVFPMGIHSHTAEAAATGAVWGGACPENGKAEEIGRVGCSACGGKGREYFKGPLVGNDYGYKVGEGYRVGTTDEKRFIKDSGNNVWEYYYRCYNCGVCTKDSRPYKKVLVEKVQQAAPYNEGDEIILDSSAPGPGHVPQRWCEDCGPKLVDMYDTPILGREASYTVYHVEVKITETYTVTVVATEGGMAGNSGTYEEGTEIVLWEAADEGYEFDRWTGATVTSDNKHVVTGNVTITANFKKIATGPSPTPVVPAEIVLPSPKPLPMPTPVPPPYEIQRPTPVPQKPNAPKPTPSAYSDIHADYCYEGTQHNCTTASCYNPIYHSHTSYCLGPSYVSGYTPCMNSSCNNGYVQKRCDPCMGKGTVKENCPTCNGTDQMSCSTCSGSGNTSKKCTTCGGDGKVNGTCGGTLKDSRDHTVRSHSTVTCTGGCGGDGTLQCSTCRGAGTITTSTQSGPITTKCTTCSGNKTITCSTCSGSGSLKMYSCAACGTSGVGSTSAVSHTYKYTCTTCEATSSSSGTCKATVANKNTCSACTSGSVTSSCSSCGGDGKVACTASNCLSGKVNVTCPNCAGNTTVPVACTTCGGVGKLPVYSRDNVCGYTTSSIVGYNQVCGKVNGAYYKNGTRVYAVCDKIVTALSPLFAEQVLEIGETPNKGAYATFISDPCTCGSHSYPCVHGDQPVREVTCTASGFNASLYNTWQTVTLSYGTYNNTAKNKTAKTTTIRVYIAGNITVSFDANGGSVSPTTKNVVYGQPYGTLPTPTRENYTFNGWIYNNAEVTADSIVQAPGNHTLIAWWDSNERTVTFNPNGGTVTPTSKTVLFGQPYGTLPTPTRTGYIFAGWWYGTTEITENSIVDCYGHPTLLALWRPAEYKITLDPNGGSTDARNVTVAYNETYNNTITTGVNYPGYTFVGWYTEAEGGERVYSATEQWCEGTHWNSGIWKYLGDTTLYAHWEVNTYTVTLNGMGATTLPQQTTTITFNRVGARVQTPTRTGYVFQGFYERPQGEGRWMFNNYGYGLNPWTRPGNGTVYAYWLPITYTVTVAEDEIRIQPPAITDTRTVAYDETYTIPSALADKNFTVSYDLMEDTTGTSTPSISLTTANTRASLEFFGWQLFRNTTEETMGGTDTAYSLMRSYNAGATVQGLTPTQGEVLTLFPYWSGESAEVTLPEPQCVGYRFMGWAYTPYETDPERYLHLEEGEANTYKPAENETLYAVWSPKEYAITLDDRGATTAGQGIVSMRYDFFGSITGEDIAVPKKTGYTFMGYYTGVRGTGTKYFDENGTALKTWTEDEVDTLYACWKQNTLTLPEKDPITTPELPEEGTWDITIAKDFSEVHIYADDNDASTDALTDKQPYLVSDVVIDGILAAPGAIPSTEDVAIRSKMGAWMFSGTMEKTTGQTTMRVYVTVPYKVQWEEEDESLHISETRYFVNAVPVELTKTWSYFTMNEGGMYVPDSVTVINDALAGRSVTIPVTGTEGQNAIPSYEVVIAEGGERFTWSNYENGVPRLDLTLATETYIIIPNTTTDMDAYVTQYMNTVCHNAAVQDTTSLSAKSDNVKIAGIPLLRETANGIMPDEAAIEQIKEMIEETAYPQTYRSGIPLNITAENGRYDTEATVTYTLHTGQTGTEGTKEITVTTANEINIHTPVVCMPEITADNESMYQGMDAPEGSAILVLDEDSFFSDFVVEIGNFGYHSDRTGYGTGTYETFLAEIDGVVQNEVSFPFPVWVDQENDGETSNDYLMEEGQWLTIGIRSQRVYVPCWTKEGLYEVRFRSVAVNGTEKLSDTEPERNALLQNYVATGSKQLYVTGRLYDFAVYDVGGTPPWEEPGDGEEEFTVGRKAPEGSIWETLPLRIGAHPQYQNLGGLPQGGRIEFGLRSTGVSYGTAGKLYVTPELLLVGDNGYEEVDVYYERVAVNGIRLTLWDGSESEFLLQEKTEEKPGCYTWYGSFSLPERLYVTKKGTDVWNYQKENGLNFSEEFWMTQERLMLRFAIRIEHPEKETLYYGMVPEKMAHNVWTYEVGEEYRYDRKGKFYKIYGGEVGVVYPEEYADAWDTSRGIY